MGVSVARTLQPPAKRHHTAGFLALATLAIDPDVTPATVGIGGGGRGLSPRRPF